MSLYLRASGFFKYLKNASSFKHISSELHRNWMKDSLCPEKKANTLKQLDQIRKKRAEIALQSKVFTLEGFGAQPKTNQTVSAKQIVVKQAISHSDGKILFHFLRTFYPSSIVELGSSIGISGLYISAACPQAHINLVEGEPSLCNFTKELLQPMALPNLSILPLTFDTFFNSFTGPKISFFFIDGDHSYHATMKAYENVLKWSTPQTCLVFHDIHWSKEMEKAWEEIVVHPQTGICIDLYTLGFVFLNPGQEKSHYIIKRSFK